METLAMGGEQMMVLVNPNHDRLYRDNLRGTKFEFQPLVKYRVPRRTAEELLIRAGDAVNNAVMQNSAERNEYLRLASSKEEGMKAMAGKFVDEKGQPVTKLWTRPPLVKFDDPSGRAHYEAGCTAARAAGVAIPEEEENKQGALQIEYLVEPKQGWTKEQLVKFIEESGGLGGVTEPDDRLMKKAKNLYAAKVKMLSKYNVRVVDPDEKKAELGAP